MTHCMETLFSCCKTNV